MKVFEILKYVFSAFCWIGLLAFWAYVILIIVNKIKKNNKRAKKCAVGAVIGIGMMGLGMFGSFVSAVKQYEFNFDKLDTFKVESDSLEGGIWKNEISNRDDGRNLNPELHWDSVKGAERYYVIMIDETADNWMHWYAENVTDNSIQEGLFTDEFSEVSSKDGITTKGQYVGPYPPSGTHTYTVYVFALKLETYSVSDINFDGAGNDIEEIAKQLNNSPYTDYNNLISYGKLSGEYTAKAGDGSDGDDSGGDGSLGGSGKTDGSDGDSSDNDGADSGIDLTLERGNNLDSIKMMLLYDGLYGERGAKKSREYFDELKAADPVRAERWAEIVDHWHTIQSTVKVNDNVLPDGLDNTNALCIVCLGFMLENDGSMKPELINRLTVCRDSALKYPNAYVLCTGGGTAPGNPSVTEAGQMAEWLKQQGIDEKRIIVEDRSTTTSQNAIYSLDIIRSDYPEIKYIAITSSNYHITTGMLVFDSEAMLRGSDIRVVSNAGFYVRDNPLSDAFQTGALIELAGDYETGVALYNGWFDMSQVPEPEDE